MAPRAIRQLVLIPRQESLWHQLPEDRRAACRELLVLLLRRVLEEDREERRRGNE